MVQHAGMRLVGTVAALGVIGGLFQDKVLGGPSTAVLARYEAAKTVWELIATKARTSGEDPAADSADEARYVWSLRLADAEVAAGRGSAADVYAQHVARMEDSAAKTEARASRGRASVGDVAMAKFFVADAKLRLEQVAK